MTDYYVSSSGSDTSPYDTWAKAATDYDTVHALLAGGDAVFIDNTFQQSYASNTTLTYPDEADGFVKVFSANTSDVYTVGARLGAADSNSANLTIRGSVHMYGVTLSYGGTLLKFEAVNSSEGHLQLYKDCTLLQCRSSSGNSDIDCTGQETNTSKFFFDGCTFDFDDSGNGNGGTGYEFRIGTNRRTDVCFRNCDWIGFDASTYDFFTQAGATRAPFNIKVIGCDLSSTFDNLVKIGTADWTGNIEFENCNLKSGTTVYTDSFYGERKQRIKVSGCGEGTITAPSTGLNSWVNDLGEVSESRSKYINTDAASDGTSDVGWEMDPTAEVSKFEGLQTPPIDGWIDDAATKVTIYLACDAAETLDNTEFWIELQSPSEEGSATGQPAFRTSWAGPIASGTALTADATNTWSGSNVGTEYKVEFTIAPTISGPARAICYLGKNTSNPVVVNPRLEVTIP
jgi:hypothetical protein